MSKAKRLLMRNRGLRVALGATVTALSVFSYLAPVDVAGQTAAVTAAAASLTHLSPWFASASIS